MLWIKVAIFWIFWTYGMSVLHWRYRNWRQLKAASKIWNVQAAWTGPELDPAAVRPELPKAQGQPLYLPR